MERRLLLLPLMLLCLLAPKVLADDDDGDGIDFDWGVSILSVESEDDGTEIEIGEAEILGLEATILEFETGDEMELTVGEIEIFDDVHQSFLCKRAEFEPLGIVGIDHDVNPLASFFSIR